jgi:hypothetical protein
MEVSGQLHAPATLLPGKETLVPIGLGGLQSCYGHVKALPWSIVRWLPLSELVIQKVCVARTPSATVVKQPLSYS